MTESVNKSAQHWTGDGVTSAFTPSNLYVSDASHISWYEDGVLKAITTDYAVTGVPGTPTVTPTAPPALDVKLTFVRDEPIQQNTDLTTINAFRAEGFEGALDALSRQMMRIWYKVSRSIGLPDYAVDGSGQFDARSNRIGNVSDPTDAQDAVTKNYGDNTYALQSAGGGDMFKATYDPDADGKVNAAVNADVVPWSGVSSKPTEFTPSAHNHTASEVTDFSAAADARIANSVQATSEWEDGTATAEGAVSPAKVAAAVAALASGGGDMLKSGYDPTNVNDDAFNQDNMADGTTNKNYTATEKTKLAGIAASATANDTDANLKDRANHTGTQTAATVSDFSTAADARITAAVGVSVQAHDADTAKTDVAQTFTALQASSVETLTAAATMTPTGTKNLIVVPLDQNATIANMTTITIGATYVFKIPQDATGTRVPSWGSVYEFPGGTAFTLSTAANAVDILAGTSFDGTSIQMFNPGLAFS